MRAARLASAGRSSRRPRPRSCATATSARAWTRSRRSRERLQADRLQALRQQGTTLLGDRQRARSTRSASRSTTRCLKLEDTGDVEADLQDLARRQLAAVMQPRLLQLRRLVIGEAGRFPEAGRIFYERGPGRTVAALAGAFEHLAERGVLRPGRPAARGRALELADHVVPDESGHAAWPGQAPQAGRPRSVRGRRGACVSRRLRPAVTHAPSDALPRAGNPGLRQRRRKLRWFSGGGAAPAPVPSSLEPINSLKGAPQ